MTKKLPKAIQAATVNRIREAVPNQLANSISPFEVVKTTKRITDNATVNTRIRHVILGKSVSLFVPSRLTCSGQDETCELMTLAAFRRKYKPTATITPSNRLHQKRSISQTRLNSRASHP